MFFGKWIAPKELWDNLHLIFKKQFIIDDFKSAKIKITADDYYKLYINGNFVGQGPAPSYAFSYNFNEYDITEYLIEGENRIEALVYYQGLTNRVWLSGDAKVGMIADIFIDGRLFLSTDESWKYYVDNSFLESNTIGYETAFLENRDLRIEKTKERAPLCVNHDYSFCEKPFPPLQIYSVKAEPKREGNRYFYDFSREYVCNIKIKALSDASGKSIIIRCAEELDESGRLKFDMRCGCKYEEFCILKEGENLIEQFDYKALRYLEITADEGVLPTAEILVRHYPFSNFKFETNNKKLNAVLNLCKNTVMLGSQEVLIDCPSREKAQYLGDTYISGFAHFYTTGDDRLLKKAIYDFSNSIRFCSRFLAVAPCAYKQEIADYSLLFSGMVYKFYQYTKDLSVLEDMLPTCDFINAYFSEFENENGLICNAKEQWNLVDWPEEARDNYEFGEVHNVINAYYIYSIESMEKIKYLLNIPFDSKAKRLKKAFNNTFFNKKSGLYADSVGSSHFSVHSNMLPLAFGISEDKRISEYLLKRGMECSAFMSYFYLKALCVSGKKNEALKFITSNEKNSWLNMINEGATTTFEAWGKNRKWNTSLFHPWSVSPLLIYYEELEKMDLI